MKHPGTLCVIIARGGSKGIPFKNMQLVNGNPLVSYMVSSCLDAIRLIGADMIFSTDNETIRNTVVALGAWAPFLRPPELAADTVQSLPVVQHAVLEAERLKGKTYDNIVYLQPTAPLCRSSDIIKSIQLLYDSCNISSVVAVSEVATHPFKMKRLLSDGIVIGRSLTYHISKNLSIITR